MKLRFVAATLGLAVLFLASCSTVPSAISEKRVYTINKVPKVLDAGFSTQFDRENLKALETVEAGKPLYMYVSVKDSDFNAEKIVVTAERDGMEEDTQTVFLNKSDSEEFTYGVQICFSDIGLWKFNFYVIDAKGNKSEPFKTSLDVKDSK